ncbi:MAG: phosphotransferase [Anaerolineales bacterium]|nr:phosphotransferase [Anaerolineales bacterium]
MREAAPLPAAELAAALAAGWGLAPAAVGDLPQGYDYAASVYRLSATDGGDYFLKVRTDPVNEGALAVPAYLHAQGLSEVLAPLPTLTGALWHPHAGRAYLLYPFIEGASPLPSGAAADQWRRFGALLRRLHTTGLPPHLAALLPRETFTPVATARIAKLDALIAMQTFAEPVRGGLVAAWQAHRAALLAVTARAEELGRRLRAAPPPALCLCHADPHWSNVLVDAAGRLWLVDWDDLLLAVPERDLMFVIGGISGDWPAPADTAHFMQGYGPAAVDPLALAYYRADWAGQDIAAFAEQVLLAPDQTEAGRQDARRLFLGQFDPDGMVAIALGSDPDHA